MGQINSTRSANRVNPPETGRETVSGQAVSDVAAVTGTPTRPDAQVSAGRRDRRKSIRNSIVNLVRPRSHRDSEDDSARDSAGSGKRWRLRRLSKAQRTRQTEPRDSPSVDTTSSDPPSQVHTTTSSSQPTEPTSTNGTSSPLHSSRGNRDANGSITGAPNLDSAEASDNNHGVSLKGKERCVDDAAGDTAIVTPAMESTHTVESSSPGASGSSPGPNAESSSSSDAPSQSTNDANAVTPSSPSEGSLSQEPSNNNFLRQFPPTGTLVVVQGVVHTDNASRTPQDNPVSAPDPARLQSVSTPDAQREQSDSPVIQRNVDPTTNSTSASQGPSSLATSESGSSTAPVVGNASENSPSSSISSNPGSNNNSPSRGSATGSNGADILGALLSIVSVATAATAASLLSNPNGFPVPSTFSGRRPTPSVPAAPAVDGPNLPLIARALATANPAAAAIIAQREREREERERNRVRSIWEGLRDRVTSGRGSRGPQETGSRSHSSAMHSIGDRLNDVSLIPDSLFNELARAFNLGPLPDERPSDVQSASSARATSESVQDGPSNVENSDDNEIEEQPSGSFEQFLVDLQADLRSALTRPDLASDSNSTRQSDDTGPLRGNAENTNLRDGQAMAHPAIGTVHEPFNNQESSSSELRTFRDEVARPPVSSVAPENANDVDTSDSNNSPLCINNREPILGPNNADVPVRSTLETPSPAAAGTGRRNGINWWRMYRFPPMHPGQSRPNSPAQNNTSPPPNTPAPATSTSASDGSPSSSEPSPPDNAGTVVPVIIVGLQSISAVARRPPPGAFNPLAHANESDDGTRWPEESERRGLEDPDWGHDTWSSRAARAFSRIGRREGVAARGHETPHSTGGARAFLIYVFGGHYPPGHHLLAGNGGMDSFEALWELAEFLGQAKPPVVTEEEIERSGLELFKARSLKEYESSGRVANNCVDRCLICLDDYNPEDDLRLLTCKHTFHKGCVDRWLKTGRNNCPACRSEGVKTGTNVSQPLQ